ncbi:hypothetical protein F511_17563 [Dorcoceras hygrometricum]|uniref:Uncharacterized protein n=1 Tax=Dorcoceras hygrometricum TaxID=472368 RepID=A0A2Z7C7Z2_9LAMI|nr:hypothetical protein F511_17563 [Dorcoceras hygrometricum]
MTSLLMSSTLSAPAELSSSADCDDITADVIIADSDLCASSQLLISSTSEHCSLLLKCSSSILLQQTSQFLFQLVHLFSLALAAGCLVPTGSLCSSWFNLASA